MFDIKKRKKGEKIRKEEVTPFLKDLKKGAENQGTDICYYLVEAEPIRFCSHAKSVFENSDPLIFFT